MHPSLIPVLSSPEVQQILGVHKNTNPHEFALAMRGSTDAPVPEMAALLDCYQRAEKKFPGLHVPGMMYHRKALEQSTGEAMIRFKQRRYSGSVALDGTGGLGMDSLAFHTGFESVIYLEPDAETCQMAQHNHKLCGISNIRHIQTRVEDWLETSNTCCDFIYLDPSRRDEKQRFFRLNDCTPDVITLWPKLLQRAEHVVIKLSPLVDLTELTRVLPGLTDILVVSVRGEVKEILAEKRGPTDSSNIRIHALVLDAEGQEKAHICSDFGAETLRSVAAPSQNDLLFEPDAAIIKAGLANFAAQHPGAHAIHPNTPYFLCPSQSEKIPGKWYRIRHALPYKPKEIKSFLASQNLRSVHIHKRNFPLSVSQLFQTFRLKMGDEAHLIFTTTADGSLVCLVTDWLDYTAH